MQVEFRSHFSGKKSVSYGPGITVLYSLFINFEVLFVVSYKFYVPLDCVLHISRNLFSLSHVLRFPINIIITMIPLV